LFLGGAYYMGMKTSSDKITNLKKIHKVQTDSLANRIQILEKDYSILQNTLSEIKDSIQILKSSNNEKEKIRQKKKASLQQSAKRQ
jgi:hypothetical protein